MEFLLLGGFPLGDFMDGLFGLFGRGNRWVWRYKSEMESPRFGRLHTSELGLEDAEQYSRRF